jgi:hypothetical protein
LTEKIKIGSITKVNVKKCKESSMSDKFEFECFHCKKIVRGLVSKEGEWAICPFCKGDIVVPKAPQDSADSVNTSTEPRKLSEEKNLYPATTVIIVVNKILGVCFFVLGLLISIGVGAKAQSLTSFVVGLIISAMIWLIFRSAAEALQVFLDIEKNTRKTSEALLEYLKNKG